MGHRDFLHDVFALSALSNDSAANRFGYLVAITTPLWDRQISANSKVEDTLWAVGVMSLASVITAAIEIIFHSLKPLDDLTVSIAGRLENVAVLLRSYAGGLPDKSCQQRLIRFSMLGTSRMRRDLQRSSYTEQYAEKMGAVVAFTGRLVDVAANLAHFPAELSAEGRSRLQNLAENIAAIRDDLLNGKIPHLVKPLGESGALETIPLLREMEHSVSLIADVFTGSRTLGAYALPSEPAEPPRRLFVPDAISNPAHIRFCIRGGCAATICYLIYNLIAWPGISTAVVTCFLTAMTTIGSSRQKQVLRFTGAIAGGAIGLGAQIFILPSIDSITGFLLLFVAVTTIAAWFATSGPRLSYFGIQIAVAFDLINLLEFKFQTSPAVAWDRVAGILLGLLVMWLVFDQLWGASAITQMLRTFTPSLRLLAQFHREPLSPDPRVAMQRTFALRNSTNGNLERLRQEADAVMFEFGPNRQRDIALRGQILDWQFQLRMVFLARIALLKYRLRLPGFELLPPIQAAQKAFDDRLAAMLDNMADRLSGTEHKLPESPASSFEGLKHVVEECCPVEPPQQLALQLRTFLPLAQRIETLVRSLDLEV